MITPRHTFDEQLAALQNELLRLGRFVEEAVGRALDALVRQDLPLAKQVVEDDDFADDMNFGLQASAMQILALQQPVASDLRIVASAMRITTDLERIGDNAVDIARIARQMAGQSFFKPLVDIPRLGTLARKMVNDALTAFVQHDQKLALQVAADDDAVDDLCHKLERELIAKMRDDATLVEQATRLLLVARMLERIADHATNIVEHVYYVETGEMRPLAREAHLAAREEARQKIAAAPLPDYHAQNGYTDGASLNGNAPDRPGDGT